MSRKNEEYLSNFGSRLKQLRKIVGLNQSELATRAGIARDTLSRYERGEIAPSLDTFASIVNALGRDIEADWLLFGAPNSVTNNPIRLPLFGSVTAIHFDQGGVLDISMGLPEIRKILDGLIAIEDRRSNPDSSVKASLVNIQNHFANLLYDEDEDFQLEMIAEALVGSYGAKLTPIWPADITDKKGKYLEPLDRIRNREKD